MFPLQLICSCFHNWRQSLYFTSRNRSRSRSIDRIRSVGLLVYKLQRYITFDPAPFKSWLLFILLPRFSFQLTCDDASREKISPVPARQFRSADNWFASLIVQGFFFRFSVLIRRQSIYWDIKIQKVTVKLKWKFKVLCATQRQKETLELDRIKPLIAQLTREVSQIKSSKLDHCMPELPKKGKIAELCAMLYCSAVSDAEAHRQHFHSHSTSPQNTTRSLRFQSIAHALDGRFLRRCRGARLKVTIGKLVQVHIATSSSARKTHKQRKIIEPIGACVNKIV